MRGPVLLASSMLVACVGDESLGTVKNDAGVSTTEGGSLEAGADASTLPMQKLVFLSSAPQNASDLKNPGATCSAELTRHGRGTGFAWAQDASGKSPTARLGGTYDGPWVLPSGKTVFATKADITGGTGAAVAINETIDVRHVTDGHIWTALDVTGAPQPKKNCDGWDNSQASAMTTGSSVGIAGPTWANDGTSLSCHSQNYLICFED